jgi:hypothetical protein
MNQSIATSPFPGSHPRRKKKGETRTPNNKHYDSSTYLLISRQEAAAESVASLRYGTIREAFFGFTVKEIRNPALPNFRVAAGTQTEANRLGLSTVDTRVLFIRHHLQRHFLGSNRYYFWTPVWKLLATVTLLGPLLPPIVLFRPSIVRFVSSDIYGATPCASTPDCRPARIRIAKRSSLFFQRWRKQCSLPFKTLERATFHQIPPMLVFWMSTLSVSRSVVSMFVRCIFLTSP